MNLERGFRRLTFSVSLAALGVALGLTAFDMLRVVRYVSAEKRSYACVREATSWAPTADDFARVRVRWDWSESPDRAKWNRFAESVASSSSPGECLTHDSRLPEHVRRAFAAWFDADLVPSWAKQIDADMRALVILALAWGV